MALRKIEMDNPAISQSRADVVGNTCTNFKAVVDSLIMGGPSYNDHANGWVFSQTIGGGTAEAPQYHTWTNQANTAERIRATYTYTGTYYVTTVAWDYTENSGSNWSPIRSSTTTYDGSWNMTGGNNSSIFHWFFELLGKFRAHIAAYTTHVGGLAHGMGTIATQASTSVSITGGNIDGTTIGATTPAAALFTRATEQWFEYSPGSGAGVTLSWAYGGSRINNSGTNTITFSGISANSPINRVATHLLYVTNLNNTNFPGTVLWGPGNKPSVAGGALISMVTLDAGSNVLATLVWKAV